MSNDGHSIGIDIGLLNQNIHEPGKTPSPTDEAFAKVPAATLTDLLKPENKATLAGILTCHVLPGRVYSDAAIAAKSAKTVQGASVVIKANDKGAFVNDAKTIATDVDASNGVIHTIDSVIMPPAK